MHRFLKIFVAAAALSAAASGASAAESIRFFASGIPDDMRERLGRVSLLADARERGVTDPVELLAAARTEYARLLEALYGEGFFGPSVSVLVDGREVADIPPFEKPERIRTIVVRVNGGQQFRFGRAAAGPLAPDTALPDGFRRGEIARTGVLLDTAKVAVDAWLDAGHPKADIGGQRLEARHRDGVMDASIFVEPGPRLRFGELTISGNEAVRTSAVGRIIGWPEGELVTPEARRESTERLRRTGAFRSVVLTEAGAPNADGSLDYQLDLVEELPRRFGFGAEYSTEEGVRISAFWLHRNLLGDAERLRFQAEVSGIGGTSGSFNDRGEGIDTRLAARFERPATFFIDTDLVVGVSYESLNEPEFISESFVAGVGLSRVVTDNLTLEGGLTYTNSTVTDAFGTGNFQLLSVPARLIWSTRDDVLDPTEGVFLDTTVAPYLGFSDAESGVRTILDGRIYRAIDSKRRFVLAGRGQFGSIFGPDISAVPADLRFFSGGGGTVRGQPYQSLGIQTEQGLVGGLSFAALSGELRALVTDDIGLVGFVDVGYVGENALPWDGGDAHAGAGLGLRYKTGLGPIRLDVALPVTESPGADVFLYVGIGQAF